MSFQRFFISLIATLAFCTSVFAQNGSSLREALQQSERVPVLVRFDLSQEADGNLYDPLTGGVERRLALQEAIIGRALGVPISELSAPSGQGSRLRRAYRSVPMVSMYLTGDEVDALVADPAVSDVYLDRLDPPLSDGTIPLIGADSLHLGGLTGAGSTVAILDTGVDHEHPMFDGRIVESACFSSNVDGTSTSFCPEGAETDTTTANAGDDCPYTGDAETAVAGCGHGTHVAGIAAGSSFSDPDSGDILIGVAPGAGIAAVQVFSRFTSNTCSAFGLPSPCTLSYTSDQIAALDWLYTNRETLDLVSANMSLGGGSSVDFCNDDARFTVIDNLRTAGVATVIASGNGGSNNAVSFPSCIEPAITVGAVDDDDVVAGFSNSADMIDMLAPGVLVNSAEPTVDDMLPGRARSISGTSMATPHVAGAFALLKAANPMATLEEIEIALESTGVPVTELPSGLVRPRIQVDSAHSALDTTPPMLTAFARSTPVSEVTASDILVFDIIFSETVADVSSDDFTITGTTAAGVLAGSGSDYTLTLSGGDLPDVTSIVGLDLAPGQDITDLAGNALGPDEPATDQTYDVRNAALVAGEVNGLEGKGLVLRNNGMDDLTIVSDGPFAFSTPIAIGNDYSVTVANQPAGLSQTCTVSSGSGTITLEGVTDVGVVCETDRFTVGGSVTGLAGSGLILRSNGGDELVVSDNGSFVFGTALVDGSDYNVTIGNQPGNPTQFCSVDSGAGTISGGDVTDILVQCVDGYTVGGEVAGLQLPGTVLELNGGTVLLIDQDTHFVFPTIFPDGAAYNMSVLNTPNDHDCMINGASGTIAGSDVENIDVSCSTDIEFADGFELLFSDPVVID